MTDTNVQPKLPAWCSDLLGQYNSGTAHAFILHGNVTDQTPLGDNWVNVSDLLGRVASRWRVPVVYDRANGFAFQSDDDQSRFQSIVDFQPTPLSPTLPRAPSQALLLIGKALRYDRIATSPRQPSVAVIINSVETLLPAADLGTMSPDDRTALVLLSTWARDPAIATTGNLLILMTQTLTDVHSSLRMASARYEAIRIKLPDLATRTAYVSKLMATYNVTTQLSPEQIAKAAAGLTLTCIEDIMLRGQYDGELTWDDIKERKKSVMSSEFNEVLEILEPRYGFEAVGGLETVKEYFRRNVVAPMRAGNYSRVPMGVLLTGAAGTGKTIIAEAVAKESGLNMAVLNPAKIFSKYVGESERNMARALDCLKSLQPCLVFVDEIDQSMRRGEEGDSGVANRVFKSLMEWMSDTGHRGQVVFLAATNRPDLMDAALKRPGRFDAKIPFFVPDATDRVDIIRVMLAKYGVPATISDDMAAQTDGYTGAEIERVVVKASGLLQDGAADATAALQHALRTIRARTQDVERMTTLAIDECDDLDLIPARYQDRVPKPGMRKPEISGGYQWK